MSKADKSRSRTVKPLESQLGTLSLSQSGELGAHCLAILLLSDTRSCGRHQGTKPLLFCLPHTAALRARDWNRPPASQGPTAGTEHI